MKTLLFRLDSERAHDLSLRAAAIGGAWLGRLSGGRSVPGLEREVAGVSFPNPLGLAAGFDKNGVALPYWRALGFGYVEVGTVTPRPQPGNPRPRMWRFPGIGALGNSMGFPNHGAEMVAKRLERDRRPGDVIGINLGKNKDTPNERAAEDYLAALEATRGVADYWVVNVSSPNTPGLRELQARGPLTELLGAVREAAGATPLFVKLSPDLGEDALEDAVAAFTDSGCAGVVATNTTLERPEGCEPFEGGLSGRPLAPRSRSILARLRELLGSEVPVISVGGIDGSREARERLEAGADLLQLYSAMVFEGPGLPGRILRDLAE